MRSKDEINALRRQLPRYLRSKGIDITQFFRCLCPEHEDKTPSMRYDEKREKVHCFGCNFDGDIYDLTGKEYGVEGFDKQFDLVSEKCKKLGITAEVKKEVSTMESINMGHKGAILGEYINKYVQEDPDVQALVSRARAGIDGTDYFQKRGLSDDLIKKRGLGYIPGTSGEPERVVIPISQSSAQERYIGRGVRPEGRYRIKGNDHYYGMESLIKQGKERPVFITEGPLDALSVEEAGSVALALGGLKYTMLLASLKEGKIKPKYPLLIALDNDAAGKKAAMAFSAELSQCGIPCKMVNIAGEYKDPNEALVANREAFMERVREAELSVLPEEEQVKRIIQKNSVGDHLLSFLEDGIRPGMQVPILSGFTRLDAVLGGGLYEGLICLGALTSLGKTTFVLQIADFIQKQGLDVLLISLEMSRYELLAKSISRETLIRCLESGIDSREACTMREVLSFQKSASSNVRTNLLTEVVTEYHTYAKNHMFIHEGTQDLNTDGIRQLIDAYVKQHGKPPVVIVDYLQIFATAMDKATDKQNIDQALVELKRISRDYHIPVIAISSFNRNNYDEQVRLQSFKESGAIEYSADVLLGLQMKGAGTTGFNVLDAMQANPREVELLVLKNRNGEVGTSICFDYYAAYNLFWEQGKPLPGADARK